MAKKKSLMMFIPGAIACVLGIAAFCMMFLQAVHFSANDGGISITLEEVGYTGAQLAFGYEEEVLGVSTTILNFNIMTTLAFFLPLIGGVLALIFKNGFITKIVTNACFVVGAVFLFCTVAFMPVGLPEASKDAFDASMWALSAGPIVAGVLSIIGAVVCFFKGTIAKALTR